MSEWKKVKIGDFLTEREGRYKPDDPKISKYKRLDKIDFSGTIHISDKPTKTDMIIVHPGDLVISGINVAKGAVAVYQGNEPVCATIHYSSYTFDSSKVDLDYFKYFVKSPAFIAALQKQVKGGIKTEIKPKHLLPLEISIPDLQTQQEIVKKISLQLQKTEQLSVEIESQKNYIKQLRQNILQDAIEGKLTTDWRKQNPVQKGNPDYDAEALFEQIQKERNNEKIQKELSPITDEEKPFEIPKGWKWVRLGEICKKITDGTHHSPINTPVGDYMYVTAKNIKSTGVELSDITYVTKGIHDEIYSRCNVEYGDLLYIKDGATTGIVCINQIKEPFSLLSSVALLKTGFDNKYLKLAMESPSFYEQTRNQMYGVAITRVTLEKIINATIPFPPLAEQKEIVKQVEKHLQSMSNLRKQITEREKLTKQLMQSLLKDTFLV